FRCVPGSGRPSNRPHQGLLALPMADFSRRLCGRFCLARIAVKICALKNSGTIEHLMVSVDITGSRDGCARDGPHRLLGQFHNGSMCAFTNPLDKFSARENWDKTWEKE